MRKRKIGKKRFFVNQEMTVLVKNGYIRKIQNTKNTKIKKYKIQKIQKSKNTKF